jgi:hypothetical protein
MDPEQGRIEWSTGREVSARTFNVSEVGNSGVRNVRLRFILSYVDSDNLEVGTDMAAQDVTVVVAPTFVELDDGSGGAKGSGGGAKSGSRSRPEPDEATESTVNYGVHTKSLGLPAAGGGLPGAPALNIPGMEQMGEVLNEARELGGGRGLQFMEEEPDGSLRSIAFLFEDRLEVGDTGPAPLLGIMGNEAPPDMGYQNFRMYLQDPDRPSELYIEEHTDHTLRFRGRTHVCAITAPGLLATVMAQSGDPCRDGERLSFTMRGAVGFPGIVSGETSYTHVSTPELEAYQNLRASRIRGILGSDSGLGGGPAPSGPPKRNDPASSDPSSPQAGQAPDPGDQSPIPDVDPDCDCSCEGLAAIKAVRGDVGLTPPEMSCARQCGGDWMFCEAP